MARKYFRRGMNLSAFCVCRSALFLSNSKEPCCTQKYATKKEGGTQTIISIPSSNFEAHALTVWKNKIG